MITQAKLEHYREYIENILIREHAKGALIYTGYLDRPTLHALQEHYIIVFKSIGNCLIIRKPYKAREGVRI